MTMTAVACKSTKAFVLAQERVQNTCACAFTMHLQGDDDISNDTILNK